MCKKTDIKARFVCEDSDYFWHHIRTAEDITYTFIIIIFTKLSYPRD